MQVRCLLYFLLPFSLLAPTAAWAKRATLRALTSAGDRNNNVIFNRFDYNMQEQALAWEGTESLSLILRTTLPNFTQTNNALC